MTLLRDDAVSVTDPTIDQPRHLRSIEATTVDLTEKTGNRVLIVDDHKLFAEVIRVALAGAQIEVVGIATTCAEGMELARRTQPDLVLADYCLPDGDGVSMAARITDEIPHARALVVSASDELAAHALAAEHLHGYLSKDTPLSQFVEAVRAVLNDDRVLVPSKPTAVKAEPRKSNERLRISQLTQREREVLALLIEGASGDHIASTLEISSNTVRSHIQNILTKLQVRSRLEAVAFAVRHRALEVTTNA